ncbi:hypothetical protein GCM10010193_64600 [Kitasatospora atroaurantiaca]
MLSVAAVGERISASRGGQTYVFCHASPAIDRITYAALTLVLVAGMSALAGGLVLARFKPRTAIPAFACFLAVVVLLVAADAVDAHGAHEARAVAAQVRPEGTCDYVPPTYTVTPGWFW